MSLIAEGLPNSSIARRLRMSEASTKTYVSRILAKLGCDNRVQAALLARDAGLGGPAGRRTSAVQSPPHRPGAMP
jgi:DNA-binding NarL/FixJ family response regulator